MCGEKEPKVKIKNMTLIMHDGQEVGPVKIVGPIIEVHTKSGILLQAQGYAKEGVLPNGNGSEVVFNAMYRKLKVAE